MTMLKGRPNITLGVGDDVMQHSSQSKAQIHEKRFRMHVLLSKKHVK